MKRDEELDGASFVYITEKSLLFALMSNTIDYNGQTSPDTTCLTHDLHTWTHNNISGVMSGVQKSHLLLALLLSEHGDTALARLSTPLTSLARAHAPHVCSQP